MTKLWIKSAIRKPGSLRSLLKIRKGKKIPVGKLAIKPEDTLLMKRRKNLAKTLGKISHYNR